MKLMRYGAKGAEKPAILDADGAVRDLSGELADITANTLTPKGLDRLRGLDLASLPVVDKPGRIAVPWIGSKARYVSEADALKHVAGYCVVNDVSEREYQIERGGGQWDKGKGCDTFGPVGPWLVTADEVGDPQNLKMGLDVSGQVRQNGSTKTMIFTVAQIVSYLSRFMTLHPGDLIATGTPPGVGLGMKPNPVYLKAGDTMRVWIEKLGEQRQTVHAWNPELIDG